MEAALEIKVWIFSYVIGSYVYKSWESTKKAVITFLTQVGWWPRPTQQQKRWTTLAREIQDLLWR